MLESSTLDHFSGTEQWYRWSGLFRNMLLTDGTQYVAENAGGGAYWLMDAIASHQRKALKNAALREFQVWKLAVNKGDNSAVLTCHGDSSEPVIIRQRIPFTDFDMDEITLWVEPMGDGNYVILLPSEH